MRRRSNGWIFARGLRGRHYRADSKPPKGATWYIAYFAGGKKIREAIGPRRADAAAMLTKRLNDLDGGKWAHPARPLTFDDVLGLVRADWRNNSRKSRITMPSGKEESGIRRLRAAFGSAEIASLTALHLESYSNRRQEEEGAAVSTVRNELNVLKHGMRLARKKGLLATVPEFPKLDPKNVRTGFFEREELDALLVELPEPCKHPVVFMYLTGWRRNEVMSRQWRHVDLRAGTIRLEPGETKSGEGRTFPFAVLPELQNLILAQRALTDEVERRTGQIVPWVFHRGGRQIKSFRTAWRAACKRIGLQLQAHQEGTTPKVLWKAMTAEDRRAFKGLVRIPHDFRRTAARNMRRAGLAESDIMELCGWETREMFKRYAIKDEAALGAAVKKYAAAAQDRQVLPIRKGAKS